MSIECVRRKRGSVVLSAYAAALLCVCLMALCGSLMAQPSVNDPWAPFLSQRGVTVQSRVDAANLRFATVVARDTRNRIWMGGYSSLTRLDGVVPKVYSRQNTPAFSQAHIRALLPLPGGSMLVGTNREGVLRWDAGSGQFETVQAEGERALTRIHSLSPARGGGAWIAAESGLFHWSGVAGERARPLHSQALEHADSPRVLFALERADGSLWVAAHAGVYVRAAGQQELLPLRLNNAELNARVTGEMSWLLSEDPQQRVWIGLVRSGVVVVDPATGNAYAPAGLDGVNGLHQGRTIRSLLWSHGRMWIGTDGAGMLSCDLRCTDVVPMHVNLSTYEGGRGFFVRSLIEDVTGRVWAASDRGVFHFAPGQQTVRAVSVVPADSDASAMQHIVRAIHYDAERRRVWLGLEAGVIQVLDLSSGRRHWVRLPAPMDGSMVAALGADRSGRIWAAGNGVAWIDPDTLEATPAGALGRNPVLRVNDLAVSGDRAWLALYDGLAEVTLDGDVVRMLSGTRRTGLDTAYITSVLKTPGGLWAGTQDGVYWVDLARWQAQRVPEPAVPNEQRTAVSFINSMVAEGDQVWLASAGGIWHTGLDTDGPRPGQVTPVADLDVSSVHRTHDGSLWYTSQDGIGQLGPDGRVRRFGGHDGFIEEAIHRNTAEAGPGNTLLLGTNAGVTLLDLPRLAARRPSPVDLSPVVTGLQRDGRRVMDGDLPAAGERLVLPPSHERLAVEFSAMDYLSAGQQRYAYRLEGHDTLWTELEAHGVPLAMYSRLPPGDYTLAMRVTDIQYPGHQWVSKLPVTVRPQWHQRADVRIATMLLLLGLGGLLLWVRGVNARARRRRLERLVNQRTAELREANARLDRLAGEDALTGLLSRGRLFERLQQMQDETSRHKRAHTLVLVDLDHFKQINDRYGHLVGDDVLREVAQRIRSTLRTGDFAGRYGGEELMVLLANTDQASAAEPLARLHARVRDVPVSSADGPVAVTASFGVAQCQAGESVEEWIKRADDALYQAKANGRDCIVWAEAEVAPAVQ